MGTLLLGLILGMRHATDPDHVLAISTIVSRDAHLGRAVRTGLFWGVGHTLSLVVVGAVLLVLRAEMPAHVADLFELFVAVMLVIETFLVQPLERHVTRWRPRKA